MQWLTWPRAIGIAILAGGLWFVMTVFVVGQMLACFMPTLEPCPPSFADRNPLMFNVIRWVSVLFGVVAVAAPLLRIALGILRRARGPAS